MDWKTLKALLLFLLHGIIFEIILLLGTLISDGGHHIRDRVHDYILGKSTADQQVEPQRKQPSSACHKTGKEKSKKK